MEELVAPLLSGVNEGAKSVPLTTPDLHLVLDRMQVRTEEIKDRVFATLRKHYSDFVELVEQADSAAADVKSLHWEVETLLKDPIFVRNSTDSFDSRLWKLSAMVKSMRSEFTVKELALCMAKSIASDQDELLNGKYMFFRGDIVAGAKKIVQVQKNLLKDEENSRLAFALLKKLCLVTSSEVEIVLADLFAQAICVNTTDVELSVTSVPFAGIQANLASILEAMEVVGILDGVLTSLTDSMYKLMVILTQRPSLVLTVDEDPEHAKIRISASKTVKESQLSVEEVYKRVVRFVEFCHQHVANYQEEWMLKLGKKIWPRLADIIIQDHLRKAIPADHTQFQNFERIQMLTTEFEDALHTENFLSEQGGKLSSFTSDIEVHFSANKRKQLLAKARNVLVQFDYSLFLNKISTSEEHEGLVFKEDKYVISYLPKQLLSIVHEALKDACSSTPRISSELYKAALDVLLLFRAIVPLQYDKSALQAAPIIHNDCLYIAQELEIISDQYHSSLPVGLHQSSTCKDLIPYFQTTSSKVLLEQFNSLNYQLIQILDEANGFKSTDVKWQREVTQAALHRVVSILKSAEETWHKFLPRSTERRLLVRLIDSAVRSILSEILSIEDMAVEETVQLHNLLEEFIVELRPVLSCLQKSSKKSIEIVVPSWRKLKCLSELLEMSLRLITKAWEDGTLPGAGFSADEVQRLIKAIFNSTSLRTECLQKIY